MDCRIENDNRAFHYRIIVRHTPPSLERRWGTDMNAKAWGYELP